MNYNEIFASCIMSELHNEADLSKSCEYCKELADFSEAIKGKGLSSKEYALAIDLFSFVYREKHHVESFGNTRESVVELVKASLHLLFIFIHFVTGFYICLS